MSGLFSEHTIPPSEVAKLIQASVMGEKKPKEEPQVMKMAKKITGISIIKAVCILVMLLCASTSGFFIYQWSVASRGPLLSIVIAVSMTIAQITLPELSILLVMKKKLIPFLAAIFVAIIALVATSFTMGATIGGIYDARSAKMLISTTGESESDSIHTRLLSSIAEKATLDEQLAWARSDSLRYSKSVNDLIAQDADVGVAEKNRDKALARVSKLLKEIGALSETIARLQANPASRVVVRTDFYSWVAKILKTDPDSVEFAMSSFPAVFNEIIAPTMLVVVMFL